jgi:hypothetical protein
MGPVSTGKLDAAKTGFLVAYGFDRVLTIVCDGRRCEKAEKLINDTVNSCVQQVGDIEGERLGAVAVRLNNVVLRIWFRARLPPPARFSMCYQLERRAAPAYFPASFFSPTLTICSPNPLSW